MVVIKFRFELSIGIGDFGIILSQIYASSIWLCRLVDAVYGSSIMASLGKPVKSSLEETESPSRTGKSVATNPNSIGTASLLFHKREPKSWFLVQSSPVKAENNCHSTFDFFVVARTHPCVAVKTVATRRVKRCQQTLETLRALSASSNVGGGDIPSWVVSVAPGSNVPF